MIDYKLQTLYKHTGTYCYVHTYVFHGDDDDSGYDALFLLLTIGIIATTTISLYPIIQFHAHNSN